MLFELIKEVHSEVDATVEDLEQSGWTRVNEPGPGDVLVWESQKGESGEFHRHIGFYIGEKRAICNDPEERKPIETHWTFNGTRAIEAIYSKKL